MPVPASAAVDLVGGDRHDRQLDVGIGADLVGVGVVAGVLVLPPPVAHADEPAQDEAGPVVPLARTEDLPVRGVMAEEREIAYLLPFVHRARYVGPRGLLPAEELHGREGLDRALRQAGLFYRRVLLPDEFVSWSATALSWPWSRTATRRHVCSTSLSWWLLRKTVVPSCARPRIISRSS